MENANDALDDLKARVKRLERQRQMKFAEIEGICDELTNARIELIQFWVAVNKAYLENILKD